MTDKDNIISPKGILAISLPAIIAVGLEPAAELIDTAILGQVSGDLVAAMAVTSAFLGSFAWIFNFLSHGATAQVAHLVGAGRIKEVLSPVRASITIALGLGLCVGVFLSFFSEILLTQVMGASPKLVKLAQPYWQIRVWGYPFTLMSIALIGVLRGLLKTRQTLWIVATLTLCNGVGTWCAVHIFSLGLGGAAAATVLSFVFADLLALIFVWYELGKLSVGAVPKPRWRDVIRFGKEGMPILGRTTCLMLAFFLVIREATQIGMATLASHQIALQLWLLASFVIDGFAVTGSSLGGRLYGAGRTNEHARLIKSLSWFALVIGSIFTLFYLGAERALISLFTQDQIIHREIQSIWLLIAGAQMLSAFVYIYDGVAIGAKKYAFLCKRIWEGFFVFFLPLLYLVGPKQGLLGLWLALLGLNLYRFLSNAYLCWQLMRP